MFFIISKLKMHSILDTPDIQRKKGSSVKGIIYEIDKATEKKLDRYEDFPKLYIKKFFNKDRKKVWRNLSKKYKPTKLRKINKNCISLGEVIKCSEDLIDGNNFGRTILKIS